MSSFQTDVLATPEAIADLVNQVRSSLQAQGVDPRATHHVVMILDEVVTNLGEHGNCRDQPAQIRLSVEPALVHGEIRDTGPHFDPRHAPLPDLQVDLQDRRIGGLGLYLVRELSSTLDYFRDGNQNLMIFTVERCR